MTNNFRRSRRTSLAVSGLSLLAGSLLSLKPASATPSGLSAYPAPNIYPKGNLHFDADYFGATNGNGSNFSTFGLTYGAGPEKDGLFGRSEFGFDYVNNTAGLNNGNRLLFNAKTQLYNNSAKGLKASVGLYGFGSRSLGVGNWVSVLGSKAFNFGRVTVGGAYATRSNIVAGSRGVLQLGFDKAITEKVIFAIDYQSGKGQFLAPGVIYRLNDKAGIELSYFRGGSQVANRNRLYFGFDYNFGRPYVAPTSPNAPAAAGGGAGAGGAGGGGG